MLNLLVKWVFFALALILIAYIIPGISISGFIAALIATLIIGIINLYIKPFIQVFTLPINILTLGIFTLVINALLFSLVAYIVPGFYVEDFVAALLGSILFSIFSLIINSTGRYAPAT